MLIDIAGHCPACGQASLHADNKVGILRCMNQQCTKRDAAHRILSDPETEHIVRFDQNGGSFNVKHPLRERIDGELLDCQIHGVVQAQVRDGQIHSNQQWYPISGTWRLKYEPTWMEDPEFGGDPFSWERL